MQDRRTLGLFLSRDDIPSSAVLWQGADLQEIGNVVYVPVSDITYPRIVNHYYGIYDSEYGWNGPNSLVRITWCKNPQNDFYVNTKLLEFTYGTSGIHSSGGTYYMLDQNGNTISSNSYDLSISPRWGTNSYNTIGTIFTDCYIKIKFTTGGPVRIYQVNNHTSNEIYDENNPIFIDTEE